MPAKSKAQKRFFYAVKNYKESLKSKKKKPKASKEIKDAAKSMSMKQINDFINSGNKIPEKISMTEDKITLVKLANHLDDLGLFSESDILDSILEKYYKF